MAKMIFDVRINLRPKHVFIKADTTGDAINEALRREKDNTACNMNKFPSLDVLGERINIEIWRTE